ncbi:ComEA family DNA-binding protein [Psychromonas sp.]|nr:ComEA family DNA-binding protein [Psychromonas sp.]
MMNKLTHRLILVTSLLFLPIGFQPIFAADMPTSEIPAMGKVNVNSADLDLLSSIKGIGAKKAQAIIDYRTLNGNFTDLNDLVNVKGIGESTLTKIMPYLSL